MTTTKAATKRAERERRRANGEKRVEVWVCAPLAEDIKIVSGRNGITQGDLVIVALEKYLYGD